MAKLPINSEEIRIQIALGTLDTAQYPELYSIKDKEILTLMAFCDNVVLRRAAAVNSNTPFKVHKKQYTEDTDPLVRECAWEHTRLRYLRMYDREISPPWQKNIDPYDIPE